MMWTRLAFLKTCGGLNVEGRATLDEADLATVVSAQAVESKERLAATMAVNFMVKEYRVERSSIEQLRSSARNSVWKERRKRKRRKLGKQWYAVNSPLVFGC
jgi:hypothetical protein